MRDLDPETLAAHRLVLNEIPDEGLRAMSAAVDSRCGYFPGHSDAVIYILRMMAEEITMTPEAIRNLMITGLLHDIGKLRVPVEILLAPRTLSQGEAITMRKHPVWSAEMAAGSGCTPSAVAAIRHHHESWDGAGYPDRLAGTKIPFEARMIAVADSFQVMTTDRPYRRAMSRRDATAELRALSGVQYDPDVVELLVGDRAGWGADDWKPRGSRLLLGRESDADELF